MAPSYLVYIHALSYHLQPVTNKRNAFLLANELHDILGVPPERGCIIFCPSEEHCLSWNGMTVLGEIDEMGKDMNSPWEHDPPTSTVIRTKQSIRSLRSMRSRKQLDVAATSANLVKQTPTKAELDSHDFMLHRNTTSHDIESLVEDQTGMLVHFKKCPKGPKLSKRKSFMQMVFRK